MATIRRRTWNAETVVSKTPAPTAAGKNYDVEGQRRRNKRYLGHQVDKGFVQCKVWVPADMRDDVVKYASNLREHTRK